MIQDHHVQFFTCVCKNWLPLLQDDLVKMILIDAIRFRINRNQCKIAAYVIMPNHFHLTWRISPGYERLMVQRDLLKFTAKSILSYLKEKNASLFANLEVTASDRKAQVWKRDSMSFDLFSEKFFQQKIKYIHDNPCQPKWMLSPHPVDYPYSSAAFYDTGKDPFDIVTHYQDI